MSPLATLNVREWLRQNSAGRICITSLYSISGDCRALQRWQGGGHCGACCYMDTVVRAVTLIVFNKAGGPGGKIHPSPGCKVRPTLNISFLSFSFFFFLPFFEIQGLTM